VPDAATVKVAVDPVHTAVLAGAVTIDVLALTVTVASDEIT
jgi:hypothetical protein